VVPLIATVGAVSACTFTTGHLAVPSTRDAELPAAAARPIRHVVGRSCIPLVVVFPTRYPPRVAGAVDDALRQGGGRSLTDVTIRFQLHYLPLVYGTAGYVAEGDAG
jgi:hypothetical protein